jgi:hypothetical protein
VQSDDAALAGTADGAAVVAAAEGLVVVGGGTVVVVAFGWRGGSVEVGIVRCSLRAWLLA